MLPDSELCAIMKKIQEDPSKKVEGLTVGIFYALQAHLEVCDECSKIADEVLEKGKDRPKGPESDWDKTRLN